jgi:peptidoglycan L-alanyl-D-glutamate endopeptidase CwlK
MTWQLSKRSKERMRDVDDRLKLVCARALELSPIDFGIPQYGGLRTVEEQKGLFDEGLSKCDGVEFKSYHQSGKALDFFAYVDGKASWDELHLSLVGAAFLQAGSEMGIPLEWGGLWQNFKDYPHIQLKRDS